MKDLYLGILLLLTGGFVITLSILKQGYVPGSPLFSNFLLGLGVLVQGLTYVFIGFRGASSGPNPLRKKASLVFVFYYAAVILWMILSR